MTIKNSHCLYFVSLLVSLSCLSSCLSSKKIDRMVGSHYGNQVPKPVKMKAGINVAPSFSVNGNTVSTTVKNATRVLPLIVYWKYDYRHTCELNPAIALANFSNALNSQFARINQKLNGRQLELVVEQVPSAFAMVDQGHILLFVISWEKFFIEPDFKDLVVSYKVVDNKTVTKSGRITINNPEKSKGLGLFQSWKSASTEYLSRYDANLTSMARAFATKLAEEL